MLNNLYWIVKILKFYVIYGVVVGVLLIQSLIIYFYGNYEDHTKHVSGFSQQNEYILMMWLFWYAQLDKH